jgi:hypothetical protein
MRRRGPLVSLISSRTRLLSNENSGVIAPGGILGRTAKTHCVSSGRLVSSNEVWSPGSVDQPRQSGREGLSPERVGVGIERTEQRVLVTHHRTRNLTGACVPMPSGSSPENRITKLRGTSVSCVIEGAGFSMRADGATVVA